MKKAFYSTSRFSWFLDNRAENSVQIADGYESEPLKKYDKEYLLELAASGQILDHVIRETDKACNKKGEATGAIDIYVQYKDLESYIVMEGVL